MKTLRILIGAVALVAACSAGAARLAYDLRPSTLDAGLMSWMKDLPDDLPLTSVSIPGTFNSLALPGRVGVSQTQTMSVGEQLERGIRAVDLWLVNSNFINPINPGLQSSTLANLDQPIAAIVAFLKAHPSETVLVKVDGSIPQAQLVALMARVWIDPKTAPYFWRPGRANPPVPTLGAVRGKMVLLQGAGIAHLGLSFIERPGETRFSIQSDDHLSSDWGLWDKWVKVKGQFGVSAGQWLGGVFHVNSLHGGGGASPWFVASGNVSSAVDSPNRATGFMSQNNGNGWEDFPRAGCIIGGSVCSIMFEGINTLALDYLESARPNHVGIVRADYPGRPLVNAIIDVNRPQAVPVQLEWDDTERCLDLKGGIQTGATELVSNRCDAKSSSQRWYVEGNGMIRSVFEPQRCVTVPANPVPGSRPRLGDCEAAASPYFLPRGRGLFASDDAAWLCLEVAGGRLADNTPLQLGTCNHAVPAQRFASLRVASPLVAGTTQCLEFVSTAARAVARGCVIGLDRQQWLLKEDATLRSALSPTGCITWRPDDVAQPLVNEYCDAALPAQRWESKPDGTLRPRSRREACLTLSDTGSASVTPCVPGAVMQRVASNRMPTQLRWHGDRCLARNDHPADSFVMARPCNAPDVLWRFLPDRTVHLARSAAVAAATPDLCLGHAGMSAQAGANVTLDRCAPELKHQRWNWMPDRSLRPESQPTLCVEAPDALTGDLHRLKLASCRAGYAAQRWTGH